MLTKPGVEAVSIESTYRFSGHLRSFLPHSFFARVITCNVEIGAIAETRPRRWNAGYLFSTPDAPVTLTSTTRGGITGDYGKFRITGTRTGYRKYS